MRICIVAEHASFRFGGEASIPLHYFAGLQAAGEDVWLVIHARTRGEVKALFPAQVHRIRFSSDTLLHKILARVRLMLPRRVAESTVGQILHLYTQYVQRRLVRTLVLEESIDIIHQPTPVSPRSPSLITRMGVPVVIGPMNGGMDYPAAFRNTESRASRIGLYCARQFSNLANRMLTGKQDAAILLVANQRTRAALPAQVAGKVIELCENAADFSIWAPAATSAPSVEEGAPRNRFVFIGRLVDWKRVDLAIEALARVDGAQLDVIGSGPMRHRWQQCATSLGVDRRVRFHGWLTQAECSQRLCGAAALVLPSVYESGGAVVLEAMAAGIPAIATNWGGPADYLREGCGFLVDPSSRETLIDGFAAAMQRLLSDPQLSIRMGQAARLRAEHHFNWARKIDRIREIYREGINQTIS